MLCRLQFSIFLFAIPSLNLVAQIISQKMETEILKTKYELILNENFENDQLNDQVWIPYYLPHWSSREKTKARYEINAGLLHLKIEYDQQPWSKEFNRDIRVSSLQTGIFPDH